MNLGPLELMVLVATAAIGGVLLYWTVVVPDRFVEAWARNAGLAPAPETSRRIRRYLLWSRRCRFAGGLTGFVLAMSLGPAPSESLVPAMAAFAGYLVGALVAELVINRPQGPAGTAAVSPRDVDDYLPRYVRKLLYGVALAFVAGQALYALGLHRLLPPDAQARIPEASGGRFIVTLLSVAILVAVTEALVRFIVGRRQPAASASDVAVDDAIRASSVRAVAAGGLSLLLLAVAGEAMAFADVGGPVGSVLALIAVATLVGSIASWFFIARTFGPLVRRTNVGATL
jgi:hypothetical protein